MDSKLPQSFPSADTVTLQGYVIRPPFESPVSFLKAEKWQIESVLGHFNDFVYKIYSEGWFGLAYFFICLFLA